MKKIFFNKIFYPLGFLALAFFVFFGLIAPAEAAIVNTATSTSEVKDFGGSSSLVLSWTASTTPGVTAVAMQVRGGSTPAPSDPEWTAWTATDSGEAIGSEIALNRYFQYRAILTSEDIDFVPELESVSIGRSGYAASSSLVSSPYDSSSDANMISGIAWGASGTSTDIGIKFQIRSASTTDLLLAAPWCGYADVGDDCLGANYFDYTKNGQRITDIDHPLMHGNNRFFQYKAILFSNGLSTPSLNSVTVTYVVNAPPEFASAIAASQQFSDGKVAINYSALDPDTAPSGVNCPNCAVSSLRYSIDNGNSWTAIPEEYLSTPGGANQGYGTADFSTETTTYSIIWDAKSQINGAYATGTKIEITLNDLEGGNNIAVAFSPAFTLDAADPAGSVVVKANGAIVNGAAAQINLSATDDSAGLQMCVTLDGTYASCVYEDYKATSSLVLTANPKRVYVAFKDIYNNILHVSAISPESPNNIIIKDVSEVAADAYQEFIVWSAGNPAVFKYYQVEHSTDGASFEYLYSVDDSSMNFYFHQNLIQNSIHYYRVYTEDINGNTSFYTTVVNDVADGVGGTNPNPPIISNVQVIATTTQSATIEWDTNELANSYVHYSTDLSFDIAAGSLTMVQDIDHIGRHRVTLTNLLPGQIYNFTVESQNALGVSGFDTNENNGYPFTTVSGPVISDVTANNLTNYGATIVWNTDLTANSTVYYSTSTTENPFENAGDSAEATAHEITLTNLSRGTTYYYYVQSGVATDNNAGLYYSFATPMDNAAPVISSVAPTIIIDTQAVINWTTSELSDSKVIYGTQSGSYSLEASDSDLAINHKIILSSLTPAAKYYFKVVSSDASGNEAVSADEYSFTTLEVLSEESEVVIREQEAAAGASKPSCPVCSGGTTIINIDRTKPVLSEVAVAKLDGESATITWKTNKSANSLMQYGLSPQYKYGYVDLGLSSAHSASLSDLLPNTTYYYKVSSIDANGNVGQSGSLTFKTSDFFSAPSEQEPDTPEEAAAKNDSFVEALGRAADYLLAMSGQVSVSVLESSLNSQYDLIKKLSGTIPAPLLSGEPRVLVTSDTATISWRTDKLSNSLVAIASEAKYDRIKGSDAYAQVVGNPAESVNNHIVVISDLLPETLYHYQVRSMSAIGGIGESGDFTFITRPKELEITNYTVEKVNAQTAIFRWLTSAETDAAVKFTPYRNGVLAVDSGSTAKDKNYSTLHEVSIGNFESGIIYEIELSSKDVKGKIISKKIYPFSTGEDNFPPTIYQVQTESALSAGKESNVQTIISWLTDEPATGQVFYQEGVGAIEEDAWEKTPIDNNYSKKHIAVLTKFEPGKVYQFKLQSADSNNNLAASKVYTILAPKQKESVFQLIIKNFEDIFGWTKRIGN